MLRNPKDKKMTRGTGAAVVPITGSQASLHARESRIREMVNLATDIFGSEKVAVDWLNHPNIATDNKPPMALLETKSEGDRVKSLLIRIDYGVLA